MMCLQVDGNQENLVNDMTIAFEGKLKKFKHHSETCLLRGKKQNDERSLEVRQCRRLEAVILILLIVGFHGLSFDYHGSSRSILWTGHSSNRGRVDEALECRC